MPQRSNLKYQRTVAGYHGCDEETALAVLRHESHLEPSDNEYDWLGNGIYFWEFGPRRALEFAREKSHIQIAVRDTECILGYFLPTLFFEEGGRDEQ